MDYLVKEFEMTDGYSGFATEAIQKAIDACYAGGGGRVILESGIYLSQTIYLKSNVELHICADAKLQGSTNPEDYTDFTAPGFLHENAAEGNSKALICASGAENIAITGEGEINGVGPTFYNTDITSGQIFYGKPDIPRPRMVILYDCRNVRFENISLVDSPCWTVWLIACEQVDIRGIKIIGDQKMINNDGIDIDSCRHVTVSDCTLKTGDDCIILRAIQPVLERTAVCEDVTVTNCLLDSCCQGIRVGCPSDNIIRNCSFSNIKINGRNGINIDNPRRYLHNENNGSMDLHDIRFTDIEIISGGYPIRIYVEDGIRLKRLSDIHFKNVSVTAPLPVTLCGNTGTVVKDIIFDNLEFNISGSEEIVCHHCRGIIVNNVEIS